MFFSNVKIYLRAVLVSGGLLGLLPLQAGATCLVDCEVPNTSPSFINQQNTQMNATNMQNTARESFNRDRSHDMGNVKNSVVGDVYIRNGHDHMEISNLHSQQNVMIDASINSVVNLGDTRNP